MSKLIRWEIIDAPTAKDPQRRRLMVKAALSDLHSLIRRFGAMCGRPKKERGGALFNFSLFVHQPNDESLDALKAELRSMTGDAAEAVRQDPTPSPPTTSMLEPSLPPAGTVPSTESGEGTAPEAVAEAPLPEAGTVPEPAPQASEENVPAPAPSLPPAETVPSSDPGKGAEPVAEVEPLGPPKAEPVPLASPPEAASTFSPGGLEIPPGEASESESAPVELTPPGAAAAPAPQAEAAAPEALAPAAAEPTPPASEENVPAHSSRTQQPLCGANLNFNPAKCLDNLKVGSYNRFAHAAATSVLANPGTMYNPLFVQGPAGSGKSHFLHGLAGKFGEAYAQEPVWLSTGTRLAAAVSAASSSDRLEELEAFAGKAKALIIDDIHLMAVSEGNAAGLAKLVGLFIGGGKQVVVSSIYPANVLAAVDESLGLKLGGGHSIELKVPPGAACKEIAIEAVRAGGIQVDEVSGAMFADRIGGDLSKLETAVARLLRLRGLCEKSGQPASLQELMGVVFGPDAESTRPSPEELKAGVPAQPAQGFGMAAALLFPDGQEVLGDWAWHQLHQAAQRNKWDFPFKQVLRKPYAIDPIGGAPFSIAGDCLDAGAVSALVVGPAAGTELANHEENARHATVQLARDIPTAVGWVPQDRIKDPKVYVLAYLDMSAAAMGGAS